MLMLELTQQEASALAAVLENVGGRPEGPRGLVDAIYDKLPPLVKEAAEGFSLVGSVRFEAPEMEK